MSTKWPSIAAAAAISGRDQVGAPAAPLAALEVAVRGRRAALAGGEDVGVHAQAHRAAGAAPVEAGGAEDLVEALGLGLRADLRRARHDHRLHARRRRGGPRIIDGRGAQVADPRVRAGADEDAVEADLLDRRAGLEAHVAQRALGRVAVGGVVERRRARARGRRRRRPCRGWCPRSPAARSRRRRRRPRGRTRAPSSLRSSRQPSIASSSCAPAPDPGRSVRSNHSNVIVVGRDHAGAAAALDRHVADRHAALHRERRDRRARCTRRRGRRRRRRPSGRSSRGSGPWR